MKIKLPTTRVWLLLIALALVVGLVAGWKVRGWYEDAQRTGELKGQIKAGEQQDDRTSQVNTQAGKAGARAEVAGEFEAREAEVRIRTVYRDRPVPADCSLPDGVRREVDAAIEGANDRVRASAGLPPSAVSHRR